jgi:hypothetical protein
VVLLAGAPCAYGATLNALGDLIRNAGRLQEAEHVEARIEIVHWEAESLIYGEEIVLAKN